MCIYIVTYHPSYGRTETVKFTSRWRLLLWLWRNAHKYCFVGVRKWWGND